METVRSENLPLNEVMRPTEARLSDTISSSTISQQHHQGQYEPYGIIGQGVLPLNIPFSLLQYAQYQDSAKVKDTLRRGKWTVNSKFKTIVHVLVFTYIISFSLGVIFIVYGIHSISPNTLLIISLNVACQALV